MKKIFLLAVATISLAACNNDDVNVDQPVAAEITATIGSSVTTRASETSWNEGDLIGITMDDRYINMKYTESGNGVFDGTTIYFKNKRDVSTISAYYPYSGSQGETPAIIEASTTIERQTEAEQPKFDFLYAVKENVTGADPNVNLTFNHRMCKLTLIFKDGNPGTKVSLITSCRIDGLILNGTFNPVTGDCSANTSSPASPLNLTPTVEHGKALPSLILFPQTVGKVTLKIIDSENQEYSCELKFNDNRLEAGNNYLYTINVNKTSLNVENYEIVNWTEQEITSNAQSD